MTYNILHTNKATRVDAGIHNLHNRCFETYDPSQQAHLECYLASFSGIEGFRAVRRLGVLRFSELQAQEVGSSGYVKLVRKCTGIPEFKLAFKQRGLLRKAYLELWRMNERAEEITPGELALASVGAIVGRYELNRLLELERLRRLKLAVQEAGIVTGGMQKTWRQTDSCTK